MFTLYLHFTRVRQTFWPGSVYIYMFIYQWVFVSSKIKPEEQHQIEEHQHKTSKNQWSFPFWEPSEGNIFKFSSLV